MSDAFCVAVKQRFGLPVLDLTGAQLFNSSRRGYPEGSSLILPLLLMQVSRLTDAGLATQHEIASGDGFPAPFIRLRDQ